MFLFKIFLLFCLLFPSVLCSYCFRDWVVAFGFVNPKVFGSISLKGFCWLFYVFDSSLDLSSITSVLDFNVLDSSLNLGSIMSVFGSDCVGGHVLFVCLC
jgi:hypothetical protein